MQPAVTFQNVVRRFGAVRAVDGVSFQIEDGEFFAMLGPSGSGKTTCLRLVAGFDEPDDGQILIHGKPMRGVPPYERPVNTVFQDYALFPHLSVVDNVAYGLMVRGMDKAARRRRAEEMLEVVALGGFGERRPAQLSGGQRQRVALARALVLEPEVLLLDEPLGALDLKLRQQMQTELKALQRKVGITFVFVTHDQDEALGMADRVAVFNQGRIEQIGTPEEVYDRPRTAFVAGFVGASNLIDPATAQALVGEARTFSLRPERIAVGEGGEVRVEATVLDTQYHGAASRIDAMLDGGMTIIVQQEHRPGDGRPATGSRITLSWSRGAMLPVEAGT